MAPNPSQDDQVELRAAEALVRSSALAVARLTDELRRALLRLEQAQAEARVVSECVAARAAGRAIARARRRPA